MFCVNNIIIETDLANVTGPLGVLVIHLITRCTEILLHTLPTHDEGVWVSAEVTLY